MKIQIVDDVKNCWKWISVHCLIASGALSALSTIIITQWSDLPPEWQDVLLHYYSNPIAFRIISFLSVFGVIGRLIKQDSNGVS